MKFLVIVDDPSKLKIDLPNTEVVSANSYLTENEYSGSGDFKVFNLCKSYKYQSYGYYVSLLAEARGHKPVPNISTIQDIKNNSIVKIESEEIEEIIHKSLKGVNSDKFVLDVYFGKNFMKKYDSLSSQIFKLFYIPFLRVNFIKNSEGWNVQSITSISVDEIPEEHKQFVLECFKDFFSKKMVSPMKKKNSYKYSMAILYDPSLEKNPSNEKAIKKFVKIAESAGIETEIITKEDYNRIPEFDILFMRETTGVNDHTYKFSRRASAEGLVVIDDPWSILKCCNKVYLTELLKNNEVSIPKTVIIKKNNGGTKKVIEEIGFPIVLKKPDGSFSLGVKKANNEEELNTFLSEFFEKSDLVLGQEFIPTLFDWRIGVLNKKPLFACKYYMAKQHWQIAKRNNNEKIEYGDVEAVPMEKVPKKVLREALKAANLIGDGLYGVDLKEINGNAYIIEVNDNPNIDQGDEDKLLGDSLYSEIIRYFLNKLEN
ncbi:Alpha-aminoadipate--LysW ligase LysX [uncultured archaeon]|nr:Alpha-aminoadipate--LysW ligase LysX [uncultured archaeon]